MNKKEDNLMNDIELISIEISVSFKIDNKSRTFIGRPSMGFYIWYEVIDGKFANASKEIIEIIRRLLNKPISSQLLTIGEVIK